MIEKKVAEEFLEKEVALQKEDGYVWVGTIKSVSKNSLALYNEDHGKSIISLSAIQTIEPRKGTENTRGDNE